MRLLIIKIKNYLYPYFSGEEYYSFYQCGDVYEIQGHSTLITKKKLVFVKDIPVGMFSNYKGELLPPYREVHISGLCESIMGMIEIGNYEKSKTMLDFLIKGLEIFDENRLKYAIWKTYSGSTDEYYVHGMGQGEILTALVKGYRLGIIKDEIIDYIQLVANSFLLDFRHINGFVERDLDFNYAWIHEYPKKNLLSFNSNNVLNGFCFGIIGLSDCLSLVDDNQNLRDLLKDCLATLTKEIGKYDLDFWSAYRAPQNISSISSYHYHQLHIVLLELIGRKFNLSEILKYSWKFENYRRNKFMRIKALLMKLRANLEDKGAFYRVK